MEVIDFFSLNSCNVGNAQWRSTIPRNQKLRNTWVGNIRLKHYGYAAGCHEWQNKDLQKSIPQKDNNKTDKINFFITLEISQRHVTI